jgi:osmotically inducible protein OsmC
MKRHSITLWTDVQNNIKLTSESNSFPDTKYTSKNKFDEDLSKNPGELMAAAHAGSFTMKLNSLLLEAGFEVETLETTCDVIAKDGVIIKSELTIKAQINDISEIQFQQIADHTLQTCPISNALNIKISLNTILKQSLELVY